MVLHRYELRRISCHITEDEAHSFCARARDRSGEGGPPDARAPGAANVGTVLGPGPKKTLTKANSPVVASRLFFSEALRLRLIMRFRVCVTHGRSAPAANWRTELERTDRATRRLEELKGDWQPGDHNDEPPGNILSDPATSHVQPRHGGVGQAAFVSVAPRPGREHPEALPHASGALSGCSPERK